MSNQEKLSLDKSAGNLAGPIRRHSDLTNHEALWLNQSGDITVQPRKKHSVFQLIRRHFSLTNQEALLLDQFGGYLAISIRIH